MEPGLVGKTRVESAAVRAEGFAGVGGALQLRETWWGVTNSEIAGRADSISIGHYSSSASILSTVRF